MAFLGIANTTTDGNNVHSGNTDCSENHCALTTAMKDSLKTFKFKPPIQEKYDLSTLLNGKKKSLVNRLSQEPKSKRGLKWFVSVQVKLIKVANALHSSLPKPEAVLKT